MQPEIFGFLIASSIIDFSQYSSISFILLLSIFTIMIQCFLFTNYIWLLFLLFELISLLSCFLIFRFKKERLFIANKVFGMYLLAGICFLASIINLPFKTTVSSLSLSNFSQIMLSIAICIKSGLFPFLWPQLACIADISVSAFLHSATAIQIGIYLLMKLKIAFLISKTIYYFCYSHFIFTLFMILFEENPKKLLAYSTQVSIACTLLQLCVKNDPALLAVVFYQALLKCVMFFSISKLIKSSPEWMDFFLFSIASVSYLFFSPYKFTIEYLWLIKGINLYIFAKIALQFMGYLGFLKNLAAISFTLIEIINIHRLIAFDFSIFFLISFILRWDTSCWISASLLRLISVYNLHFTLDLLALYLFCLLFVLGKLLQKVKKILILPTSFHLRIDFRGLFNFILKKEEIIIAIIFFTWFLAREKTFIKLIFPMSKTEGQKLISKQFLPNFLKSLSCKEIILIPSLLFSFFGILGTTDKINLIFYLNLTSLVVVLLFWSYGAHEIAVTQLLSDCLLTIIMLKSTFLVSFTTISFFNIFLSIVIFGSIIICHPGAVPALRFPIDTVEKIILDYRLIDTLFEILIFYLIGKFLYPVRKDSEILKISKPEDLPK